MPIIDTIEPREPDVLQAKIFATTNDEDYVILRAVQEHLDKFGYESSVEQTKTKPRDVRFAADKCIVFLIMGTFMLADGTKVGEKGKGLGIAHVVEDEEGFRLGANSAVALIYVHE